MQLLLANRQRQDVPCQTRNLLRPNDEDDRYFTLHPIQIRTMMWKRILVTCPTKKGYQDDAGVLPSHVMIANQLPRRIVAAIITVSTGPSVSSCFVVSVSRGNTKANDVMILSGKQWWINGTGCTFFVVYLSVRVCIHMYHVFSHKHTSS